MLMGILHGVIMMMETFLQSATLLFIGSCLLVLAGSVLLLIPILILFWIPLLCFYLVCASSIGDFLISKAKALTISLANLF